MRVHNMLPDLVVQLCVLFKLCRCIVALNRYVIKSGHYVTYIHRVNGKQQLLARAPTSYKLAQRLAGVMKSVKRHYIKASYREQLAVPNHLKPFVTYLVCRALRCIHRHTVIEQLAAGA